MGDWKADSLLRVNPASPFPSYAYYWVMPVDVAGAWKVQVGKAGSTSRAEIPEYELRIEQRYQDVTLKGTASGESVSVSEGKLRGDSLSFTIVDSVDGRPRTLRFSGRVTDNKATGTLKEVGGKSSSWTATRAEPGPRPEIEPADTSAGGGE
jgi:hypothetical protein